MYLARPYGLCRLERPPRPDRKPGLARSWSEFPAQCTAINLTSVIQKFAPIIEPFCNGPKTEVALINVVQVYCYEDTRIIKAFPQILKVGWMNNLTQSKLIELSTGFV